MTHKFWLDKIKDDGQVSKLPNVLFCINFVPEEKVKRAKNKSKGSSFQGRVEVSQVKRRELGLTTQTPSCLIPEH